MSNFVKVSPVPKDSDIEMECLGDDSDADVIDPQRQMFEDLPSRGLSRMGMNSRQGKNYVNQSALSDEENNTLEKKFVNDQMNMIDLEDSSEDPLAETRNLEKIRSMTVPMAQRKSVKLMHDSKSKAKKKKLSHWKSVKLKLGMSFTLFKSRSEEFFHSLELWKTHLKEVEGHFGNGTLSYFLFLKSLLLLNVIIFAIVFGFLTVPQVVQNHSPSLISQNISINAIVDSLSAKTNQTNSSATALQSIDPCKTVTYPRNLKVSDHILDFFTGQGWVNTTVMFYSSYANSILKISYGSSYNMPLAYMLVGGSYFIISLFIMISNFSQGFTESVIESGGLFYSYCNKIFASWDYCITNRKAADLKKKNIYQDLEAELAEEKRREKIRNRTRLQKCRIITVRGAVTLIILGLLAGSVYAIILAVGISTDPKYSRGSSFLDLLRRWASSLTITALNLILPEIFEILTDLEDWSPRVDVAMKLWRAVLLKLASVAVLVIVLYTKFVNHKCNQCWENQIGAQMFNLIWIDFFVIVGTTICGETARKYMTLYLNCGCQLGAKIGMQEFQIPKNVLDLVYGQSLIWIGTFFCPLIPAIGVLKLIVLFYVKKISLMFNCKPSSRPYQGARSNYFFTLLLLLTFLLCVIGVGWGITRVTPSCCGPYKNPTCKASSRMFDIISITIQNWPKGLQDVLNFVKTPAFLVPILIIICLLLYYFRSMTAAHERMIDMLKDQLTMEGRDKRFLMERLLTLSKKVSIERQAFKDNETH